MKPVVFPVVGSALHSYICMSGALALRSKKGGQLSLVMKTLVFCNVAESIIISGLDSFGLTDFVINTLNKCLFSLARRAMAELSQRLRIASVDKLLQADIDVLVQIGNVEYELKHELAARPHFI